MDGLEGKVRMPLLSGENLKPPNLGFLEKEILSQDRMKFDLWLRFADNRIGNSPMG